MTMSEHNRTSLRAAKFLRDEASRETDTTMRAYCRAQMRRCAMEWRASRDWLRNHRKGGAA